LAADLRLTDRSWLLLNLLAADAEDSEC